jgi:hypothetical protein
MKNDGSADHSDPDGQLLPFEAKVPIQGNLAPFNPIAHVHCGFASEHVSET